MGIRIATSEDSEELCAMLERAPMGERIRLTFERRPDYFQGAGIQAEQLQVYVGETRPGSGLTGVFAAGSRNVFLHGEEQQIRYLSDLRIDPAYRGGRWLVRGWRLLREEVFAEGEFAQTLILRDNAEVMDLLTSRRPGLPRYHPAGKYLTHFIPVGQRKPALRARGIRSAENADLAAVQNLIDQEGRAKAFFPCYRLERLGVSDYHRGQEWGDFLLYQEDGGELLGMAGIWDQSAFKQTRVKEYVGLIKWLRPWSGLLSGVPLPRPGEAMPLRYLHTILCRDNDPELFATLLGAAVHSLRESGFEGFLVVGLDAEDPLNRACESWRRRTVEGGHFLVSFEDSPPPVPGPFYFECARI